MPSYAILYVVVKLLFVCLFVFALPNHLCVHEQYSYIQHKLCICPCFCYECCCRDELLSLVVVGS